ncbi:toxin-antitoxin system TumE family protein [Cyanobacterium sp. IPPAS B-1200]|uniref:toxin-antitoxin system TumE family protein n=1 Tax=Cyanobacterium sp. IPPAS B-1200 TaxID=1562720 RepID=UPI0008527E95|nr:DUF6516 family protein [Cyanobacterium sp. IPPAS B-1200]OEJ79085.1 hypothetical protein A5482_11115 [Cyanobacterium sp. IPPAS B-1200]
MLLSDYPFNLQVVIHKYVTEGIILSSNVSVDARSIYLGYIQGKLDFINGFILFFKEYIDLQISVDKLAYSFHYQDLENNLIFRYDNAKHKPDLGFIEHKHIKNEIISSQVPSLEEVILEIIMEHL